jgi:ABC-2 type transport system permease protein
MKPLLAEWKLMWRSPLVMLSFLTLLAVAAAAVVSGLVATEAQRKTIAAARALQQQEIADNAHRYDKPQGTGDAAYYTFHPTWNSPSPLAFLALGQRDVHPWLLRIRALGLQAQIHDSEAFNPELALPGRFDFAFVLIFLTPLVIVVLTHDLKSGEREAGRLSLLQSLVAREGALWRRRLQLRAAPVLAALLLPLLAGALWARAPIAATAVVVAVTIVYVAFWFGLAGCVAAISRHSSVSALRLSAAWVMLTLLLPALTNLAIQYWIPIGHGVELTLKQREIVHRAWDIPKQETIDRFVEKYPQWQGRFAVKPEFQWDWYFVMHRVGDDAVAEAVALHRQTLLRRDLWTERVSYLLPGVATQRLLERIAGTDLTAHLQFVDAVAAFHDQLLQTLLPRLITEQPFKPGDFDALPTFHEPKSGTAIEPATAIMLALLALLALLAAHRAL